MDRSHHHINFAPVVPVSVAEQMQRAKILGPYHLLLAHDVIQNADRYRSVYNTNAMRTIIMDNSVIELGYPVSADMMSQALSVVEDAFQKVVVLPDKLLDMQGTLDAIDKAYTSGWVHEISTKYKGRNVEFMAIPQGADISQWVKCAEEIINNFPVTWIGIPRNFNEKLGGLRIQACQLITMLAPHVNMHLMGFSDDLHDDLMTCHMSKRFGYRVWGIDSAVPIRMAMRDKQAISFSNQVHSARGDWWDNPGEWNDTVSQNVTKIRNWVDS